MEKRKCKLRYGDAAHLFVMFCKGKVYFFTFILTVFSFTVYVCYASWWPELPDIQSYMIRHGFFSHDCALKGNVFFKITLFLTVCLTICLHTYTYRNMWKYIQNTFTLSNTDIFIKQIKTSILVRYSFIGSNVTQTSTGVGNLINAWKKWNLRSLHWPTGVN